MKVNNHSVYTFQPWSPILKRRYQITVPYTRVGEVENQCVLKKINALYCLSSKLKWGEGDFSINQRASLFIVHSSSFLAPIEMIPTWIGTRGTNYYLSPERWLIVSSELSRLINRNGSQETFPKVLDRKKRIRLLTHTRAAGACLNSQMYPLFHLCYDEK